MPLALLVLVVGFLPWRSWGLVNAQGYVSMLWLVLTLFIIVDTTVLLMRMNRELKKQWPVGCRPQGRDLLRPHAGAADPPPAAATPAPASRREARRAQVVAPAPSGGGRCQPGALGSSPWSIDALGQVACGSVRSRTATG